MYKKNILPNGEIKYNYKITDFGFAKELNSGLKNSEIRGTIKFLAPE